MTAPHDEHATTILPEEEHMSAIEGPAIPRRKYEPVPPIDDLPAEKLAQATVTLYVPVSWKRGHPDFGEAGVEMQPMIFTLAQLAKALGKVDAGP